MGAANIKAGIEITAQTDGADGIARLEAAVGRLDAAAHKAGIGTDALARAGGGLGAQADALPSKLTTLSSSISGMGRTMLAAAGVGGGIYAVKEGLQRILETTTEFAAIRSRMEYAFGGADAAAEQLEWVKGVAAELGLELKNAANGYAQLAAATKNINMSTEATQQVFKGVASAAASMNLSTEETNGVLLALSQIAGKGRRRSAAESGAGSRRRGAENRLCRRQIRPESRKRMAEGRRGGGLGHRGNGENPPTAGRRGHRRRRHGG